MMQGGYSNYQSPMMNAPPPSMNQPVYTNQMPTPNINQSGFINQMAPPPSVNQQGYVNQIPQMNQPSMNYTSPSNQYGQSQYQYGMANSVPPLNYSPPPPTTVPQNYFPPNPYGAQTPNVVQTQLQGMPMQDKMPPVQSNPAAYYNQSQTGPGGAPYSALNQYASNTPGGFNPAVPQAQPVLPPQGQFNNCPGIQTGAGIPVPIDSRPYNNAGAQQIVYPSATPKQPTVTFKTNLTKPIESGPVQAISEKEPLSQVFQDSKDASHERLPNMYKCSDFPTLFTGNFRYSKTNMQRKPFTMRDPTTKQPIPQHNPSKHTKRLVETKGPKFYECFVPRANGTQDCAKGRRRGSDKSRF